MIGYETVFITHPDLEEADLKKSLKKFKDIIKKGKGKLVHEYLWGRRRLAYQIANQNHGVYHIWYLQGTGRSSTNSKPSSDTTTKYSVFKR